MFTMLLVAATSFVTPKQSAEMLQAIDNMCGDTWCEGEYNFRFDTIALDCKTKSVKVDFIMFPSDQQLEDIDNPEDYAASCTVPGYYTYDQIMDNEHSLNWEFYLELGKCINALEDSRNQAGAAL